MTHSVAVGLVTEKIVGIGPDRKVLFGKTVLLCSVINFFPGSPNHKHGLVFVYSSLGPFVMKKRVKTSLNDFFHWQHFFCFVSKLLI